MATGGENESLNLSKVLCSPCLVQDKHSEANKFCTDCQDYYCGSCVKIHDSVPALTRHKIIDRNHCGQGSYLPFPMVPTDKCDRHGHKTVDMYCRSHDAVGCSTCMSVEHRSCQDTGYIPELVRNKQESCETSFAEQQLQLITDCLNQIKNAFNKEKERVVKMKTSQRDRIKTFREEMNEWLDKLEKSSINDLEGCCYAIMRQLEESIKRVERLISSVKSAEDHIRSAGTNSAQAFVSVKRGNAVTVKTETEVRSVVRDLLETQVEFVPETRIVSLIQELKRLGKLPKISRPVQVDIPETFRLTNPEERGNVHKNPLEIASVPLLRVNGKSKHSAKVMGDVYTCRIVSMCALADGTILLSDCQNCKLKRLDSQTYKVRDWCDLPVFSWQVCVVSDQQVAVCCPYKQTIQFVHVSTTMRKSKNIMVNFDCRGLAFADEKLYVSDSRTSVYVFSISGEKLQQFSKDQDGQALFSDIRGIVVSSDGSFIYVTDYNNGLIELDKDGQTVAQFSGPELKGAEGICLHNNQRRILVVGSNSQNVLQFNLKGELVCEVTKTEAEVRSICVSGSKVIIGYMADIFDVLVCDI